MMRVDTTFAAEYEIRTLTETPAGGARHVFERADRQGGGEVLIEVFPDGGKPWVGIIRKALPTVPASMTALYTTPNRRRLCAIAAGDAYLIDVDAPEGSGVLETRGPVVTVRPILSEGLLLLVSPWVVTAIDAEDQRWQTGRLAVEGLRLDEMDEDRLAGVADPDDDEPTDFVIDLRTGDHEGGVPFA
jgi:hypothetical protein